MTEATQTEIAETEAQTLTLDQILKIDADAQPERVYIPAWGGYVKVRPLRVAETEKIERLATNPKTGDRDAKKVQVFTLMESLVEPKLGFAEAQKLLLDGRTGAIGWLWSEINRVNSTGPAAVAAAARSFRPEPTD